ncbi:MAG: YdbH domain-containing protein [Gammaproteobacteria bacterium]
MALRIKIPRILYALTLLGVLSIAAVWMLRAPLLAWLCEAALSRAGLGPAQVEIHALDLHNASLRLRASSIGTIERVEIAYGWTPRTGPVVRQAQITGARLRLPRGGGSAQDTFNAGGETSSAILPTMLVDLDDARLVLPLGDATLEVEASGSLTSGPQPAARLAFTLRMAQSAVHGRLAAVTPRGGLTEATLTFTDGTIDTAWLNAQGLSGSLLARTDGKVLSGLHGDFAVEAVHAARQAWGGGTLAISQSSPEALTVDLTLAPLAVTLHTALPTAAAPRPFTFDGRCDARALVTVLPDLLVGAGTVRVEGAGDVPALPFVFSDWLRGGSLRATATMNAQDVNLKAIARADAVTGEVSCALGAGALICVQATPLEVSDLTLEKDVVAVDSPLSGPLSLRLMAVEAQPLLALAAASPDTTLALAARLGLHGRQLALDAPLTATLTVEGGSPPNEGHGSYTLKADADAEHPPGTPWLAPRLEFAGHYTLDVARRLRTLVLDTGHFDLPAQGWVANAWHGSFHAAETNSIELSVDDLRSTRAPPLLVPLKTTVSARQSGSLVTFKASVHDAAHVLELGLTGRHSRHDGRGDARITLKPITLTGRKSLTDLAPALGARVSAAGGEIEAWGEAHWDKDDAQSALSLRLENLSFDTSAARISGLNATLDLTGLAPLRSGPGQRVEATLALPGLKRVPIAMRYSVDQRRLRIDQLHAAVFGGALTVHDGDVDIASGVTQLDLEVLDLDLASALTVLDLEQVKGTGRLSGHLPLRFEAGRIAVLGGRLAASGPGVIRIGATQLTDALQGQGRDVDLALRALSDFHYQKLAISAEKPLAGAGRALFHLEGNNPLVMDAQPFVFNINLETDFDYLAGLLFELSGLTTSTLGWSAGAMLKD